MARLSLKETIREILREHLEEHHGILLGECVSDPGGVAGTIPESRNVIDLPMTETAGADFAVGCALAGRRPVFVVRFQDFMLMNAGPFLSFAAPNKYIHGIPAPVFIRALANDCFDATHSNVLHSQFMHFPGIDVCAPVTPGEYRQVWDHFMQHDVPVYCSEYRDTFSNTQELEEVTQDGAQLTVFGVSVCRMHIRRAAQILQQEGIRINIRDILWLKPFDAASCGKILEKVPLGLVVDPGHVICGAARSFAYEMMMQYPHSHIEALGIRDTFKTTNPHYYNEVPSPEMIAAKVRGMLRHGGRGEV